MPSPTYESIASGTDSTASPKTWTHRVYPGNNRLLVVAVALQGAGSQPTTTAVTFKSVAMTKVLTKTGANPTPGWQSEVTFWLLRNPPVGSFTISATITAPFTSPDYGGHSWSFSNAKQSLTPDATGTSTGTVTGSLTNSVTTVTDGCWILSVMNTMNDGSTVGTLAVGDTQRANFNMSTNVNGILAASDTNAAQSIGTKNMTYTYTGGTGAVNFLTTGAAIAIAPTTVAKSPVSLRPHPFQPGIAR